MGPVHYYSKLATGVSCLIEQDEHYRKQTYRNRAVIYDANGALKLIIPLKKHPEKTAFRNIQLSYDAPWQDLHWKSLESAYRSSPFFEYYEHDFADFYTGKKYTFLIDFNLAIHEVILRLLKLQPAVSLSNEYKKVYDNALDFRDLISPKYDVLSDPDFRIKPYPQVFEPKHGFLPNLSIVDLLFNEGPQSQIYLLPH
jgi:hypothetical protein